MAALVFSQLFFPSVDPMVGTMLAFSTYAIGYLSRPLGGLFFGRLGDKIGRRAVLVITRIIMGLTTATIGLLPTYGSAGILAPLLLISLRFVQGVALGGEWAGAVLLAVEHGRQDQRGLNASCGPSIGHPSWHRTDLCLYFAHGQRNFPSMGLASSFSSQPCPGHVWTLGPQRR